MLGYLGGITILIWKKYRINYNYIFEISPQGQISPWTIIIYS